MAPRTYADKHKRQTHRILKPSSSTDVRTRIFHSSHRPARNGTATQLETVVPHASPTLRPSPTSRDKHLLEATNPLDILEELETLRYIGKDRRSDDELDLRFIPTGWGATPALELPEIDHESSPEEATDLVEQIKGYFDFWSKGYLQEGPASLFADMRLINCRLEELAELPWEPISSPIVSTALRECMFLYECFVETWRKGVLEALVTRLDQLRAQLRARITGRLTTIHEIEFASFASDVTAVSPCFIYQAVLGSTDHAIPFLVSEAAMKRLLESADKLLFVFQDATYETEAKELWLLIWRSLKVTFAAFNRGGAPTSPTNTLRDRQFFEVPAVLSELQRLVRSSEAANPRSIEEVVGQYCNYIDQCQVDQENKYESLHRTHETPLESHTKDALKDFCKTGKFETSTLSKIHFAVARFNKINGGPVKVWRWQAPHDTGIWQMIPLELESPSTTEFSPSIWGHILAQQDIQSSPPFTPRSPSFEVNGSLADTSTKRVFPYPEGINLKSDFDYVWCPFPETRAHEVAQNEQISREMVEPGNLSVGPRPDYLINRPPRHARDPAELTRRNFGPFPWIRFVIQQLFAKERHLPDVKKPNFTGLLPQKDHNSSSESRSAILDRNMRVYKPTASAQVHGLRGGAGRPSHWSTGPSRGNQFDSDAFHRKMIDLCAREIRGRYGLNTPIDQADILWLLAETGFDIQEVGKRYAAPGRGKTAGPNLAAHVHQGGSSVNRATAASQDKLLHPVSSLYGEEDADVREYRVNNSPRPTRDEDEEQYIYDDNNSEDDLENCDPHPLGRTVLGELNDYPGGRYDRSDVPAPSSHGSDQPARPRCHRCPTFEGQYHHYCHDLYTCPGYQIRGPDSPQLIPGPLSYLPNDAELDDLHAAPVHDRVRDWTPNRHTDAEGHGTNSRQIGDPQRGQGNRRYNRGGEQDGHDRRDGNGDHIEDDDKEQDNPPPEKKPADEDEWTVEEVFSVELAGFLASLTEMGQQFRTIQDTLDSRNWVSNATGRRDLLLLVTLHLTSVVPGLRDDYLSRLQQGPVVETVDEGEYYRPRAARRAHPATPELCRRTFRDVEYRHRTLTRFFDFTHPRRNLGFRHAFNALIIAVREFDMLLREYHQGLENPDFNNGDDDDDEEENDDDENARKIKPLSTPSSGSVKTPTPAPRKPPQKSPPKPADKHIQNPNQKVQNAATEPKRAPLPTREAYEAMFVPELLRELQTNRRIKDIKAAIDKKSIRKEDYIELLMKLDREGNFGRGATEGYRNIAGDPNARFMPKNWDREKALKEYYEQKAKEKDAIKSSGSSSSRKGSARSKDSGQTVDLGPFQQ